MSALYFQIILGVVVVFIVVIAFILTIRSGQYDDLESPSYRILMDDDDPRIPHNNPDNQRKNTDHPHD